ncbi:hypothetical protein LSH36_682g01075 [Paralvinella palmiformis]|uniref:Glycosyltransferase family 92 protein n=1 Tax=Paralvinella palmiformis TaxID=53620 RepID=A0AAD9MWD2_9ANNE|nr:hypothetical protein LSH36_682g01075 [Paralvinella palmiformis]
MIPQLPFVLWWMWLIFESGRCAEYCKTGEDEGCVTDSSRHLYREGVTCPDVLTYAHHPDKESQTWQEVPERDIIAFSAFIERRTLADGPSVRIVAAGLQEDYNRIGDVHCLLWYETDIGTECVTERADYVRIYPSTLHPDMWVSHFIICPLKRRDIDEMTPYAVSVVPRPCDVPRNLLKIANRRAIKKTNSHALCLPPIYNHFSDWRMLVEMIELHRILGISELVIYNQSMSTEVSHVLDMYAVDPSFSVNIVQWHFPGNKLKNNVNCQRGAINDCVYRMSARHRYVTVTDLDEVVVPRNANTWPEMMRALATTGSGVYMFQHAYFRRNNTGQTPCLITQQSLWRTDKVVPEGKVRCKSMYDTDSLLSLDLHYHYALVPGAVEYLVPPDVGMLHHYRSTPMSSFRENPEKYTYIEDTYMHRYYDDLVQRFNNIVTRANLKL